LFCSTDQNSSTEKEQTRCPFYSSKRRPDGGVVARKDQSARAIWTEGVQLEDRFLHAELVIERDMQGLLA